MDYNVSLLNFLFTGAVGILLWFIRQSYLDLKGKTEELEKMITNVKLEYVHKEEFKEFKKEIAERFDKLTYWLEDHDRREQQNHSDLVGLIKHD